MTAQKESVESTATTQDWLESAPLETNSLNAQATTNRATSRSIFLGTNESDSGATGAAIYNNLKNFPIAAACIMQRMLDMSGFHPFSQDPRSLSGNFYNYINAMSRFPLLNLKEHTNNPFSFANKNYSKILDNFSALLDRFASNEKQQIRNTVLEMVSALAVEGGGNTFNNNFVLTTLNNNNNGMIEISIFNAILPMISVNGQRPDIDGNSSYTITKIVYQLSFDPISRMAGSFAQLPKATVQDLMNHLSSPLYPGKICFS